jgi:hypothetical protein
MKKLIGFFVLIFFVINGCQEIFEESLDKEKVVLIAPMDSLVSTEPSQTFYWQPLDSGTKYELLIVKPRFDSIVSFVADTILQRNQFQISLMPGSYQWRVRAFNSSSTTQYSLPWSLTIH